MSCWVVPMIAAEMWGIPVSAVLAKIQSGEFPTRVENGFTFIDVAPNSPTIAAPKFERPPHPPTYTVVTGAEIAALTDQMDEHGLDEHQMPPLPIEDWRTARKLVARTRRAPGSAGKLAG